MIKNKAFFLTIIIIVLLFSLPIVFSNFSIKKIIRRLSKKPNILLVTVCSLRQDHLGCYKYLRNTSPNIDSLSNSAILFRNAYTHIPWTGPSVISLMSGRYPASTVEVKKTDMLPSLLHSAGYITCGIVGTSVVRDAAKIFSEFDIFMDHLDLETSKDDYSVQGDTIVEKAIETLKQLLPKKRPIFLWLFFKDPHWKYLPPFPYKEKFLFDSLYGQQSQKLSINNDYNSFGGISGAAKLWEVNGEVIFDKAYYISQYDAEILFMDEQLGRVIAYLKNEGSFNDWLIVFSSDHGESFGEDGYFFDHGSTLPEGTTKIPFIIKLPGQVENIVRDDPVAISDIAPTITELLGLNKKRALNKDLEGRNIFDRSFDGNNGRQYQKIIVLENQEGYRSSAKLVGGILNSYKLICNISKKEEKLYSILKEETLLKDRNRIQARIIEKMNRYIMSFFNKFCKADFVTKEQLTTLGYLQ